MDLPLKTIKTQRHQCVDAIVPPLQLRTSSQALLGPGGELIIAHAGREYRLRVTRNGKLILTA